MQKRAVFYFYVILRAIRAGRCRERRYADHIFIQINIQNAPFRSQIFKNFFTSGDKGTLTPRNQNPAAVPDLYYFPCCVDRCKWQVVTDVSCRQRVLRSVGTTSDASSGVVFTTVIDVIDAEFKLFRCTCVEQNCNVCFA